MYLSYVFITLQTQYDQYLCPFLWFCSRQLFSKTLNKLDASLQCSLWDVNLMGINFRDATSGQFSSSKQWVNICNAMFKCPIYLTRYFNTTVPSFTNLSEHWFVINAIYQIVHCPQSSLSFLWKSWHQY